MMEILKHPKLVQLIFVCISAFLGFLSAIVVEWLYKKYIDNTNKKVLLKGIYTEISNIKRDIQQLNKESYYLSPLEKPFWESSIYSGSISLIEKSNLYSQILNIYSMVDAVNRWENLKTQTYYLSGTNPAALSNGILKHIEDLKKEIDKILITLNKYSK